MNGRTRHCACIAAIVAMLWLCTPNAGSASTPQTFTSAARYSAADSASEYWDFTARFDTEHRLFARFIITNEGPGKHSAVAVGHLIFPDGRVVRFKNGRKQGRWELSEDRLRIRIGSSILDQHGPTPKLEVDNDKRGVKIHLFYEPDGGPPAPSHVPGIGFELLDSGAPVRGTVWVKDMDAPLRVSGTLAATHVWMDETESKLALRRIEFFALADDLSIYLSDVTAPEGARRRWLLVERNGEVLYSSERFELSFHAPMSGDEDYPLPATLRFAGNGLDGEIRLGRVVLEHDPLEVLPQPFRFLLSLRSRPHRVWADSPFEVTLQAGPDRSPLQFRGSGITNVTFLNPVPDKPGV